jgi:oligopeptide transport system ATP-binding protein
MGILLDVRNLKTQFSTSEGVVKAVDGVSYTLDEGETLGLVGESGCGKSVSALSVMRLIPNPPGKITEGEVIFEGQDILKLPDDDMRHIRGNRMAMVFQEPMTSLNPVLTIGDQIMEAIRLHKGLDDDAARKRAVELMEMVGIPEAKSRLADYPHQFSGGMRQRVMIAMGMSCEPKLLLADEPTTALDVTIQAQVLEIMKQATQKAGAALILITHNLGVVARYAQTVNVMYAGRIIERGPAREIYANPAHPYTVGLLKSIPRLDEVRKAKLDPIEGLPPDLIEPPPTCAFLPRCPFAIDRCRQEPWPPLTPVSANHTVSCYVDVRTGRARENAT